MHLSPNECDTESSQANAASHVRQFELAPRLGHCCWQTRDTVRPSKLASLRLDSVAAIPRIL